MSDVKMPIITKQEGNKITKICVEDIYKIVNRVCNALDKAYNNSSEILNTIEKTIDDIYDQPYYGQLIVGKGISQPCIEDAFDEEIGNNIAFMKAKLNANIKKHNLLCRIYNELVTALESIDNEIDKVDDYIILDLNGVRQYNPSYLLNIESKLGI